MTTAFADEYRQLTDPSTSLEEERGEVIAPHVLSAIEYGTGMIVVPQRYFNSLFVDTNRHVSTLHHVIESTGSLGPATNTSLYERWFDLYEGVSARTGIGLRGNIESVPDTSTLISLIEHFSSPAVSYRLRYLQAFDDDPDETPMDLGALRSAAEFIFDARGLLPDPDIGVGANGEIGLSWPQGDSGLISLMFKRRDLVRLSGVRPSLANEESPSIFQMDIGPNDIAVEEVLLLLQGHR